MKKIIIVALIASIAILISNAQNSNGGGNSSGSPCDNSTWASQSHSFPSGNIKFPADRLPAGSPVKNFDFSATMEWQQKSYVKADKTTFICSLKDPKITFQGEKTISIPVGPAPSTLIYTAIVGPRFWGSAADKFGIDASMVTPGDYGAAFGLASAGNPSATPPVPVTPLGGTTKTTKASRDVSWHWNTRAYEPKIVEITGAEGARIEIDHTSPYLNIAELKDENGLIIALDINILLSALDPPSSKAWEMKHAVQKN